MLLEEQEIQQAIERAKAAFPNFTDWKYNNDQNESYWGFSLWGQCILDPEEPMSRRFFVTLNTYEEMWQGHLTIGQPCYFWSSADAGDAHLLDTKPCDTLEDAISALKVEMLNLFRAFSVV